MAFAEIYRGDGEIMANPTVGTIPYIGARLARATFEPDLVLSDGEAMLVANNQVIGKPGANLVEGWMPYRLIFEVVWSGRRHVVMGASQVDRYGDTNIASIGPFENPKVQLLGPRGAPGNTVNHASTYWVPGHSERVFVEKVDFVSGVGPSRAARQAGTSPNYNDIRFVISDLCVLDFKGEAGTARLVSVHPGVGVEEIRAKTGFPLENEDRAAATRTPTPSEMELIEQLDPDGVRYREVSA